MWVHPFILNQATWPMNTVTRTAYIARSSLSQNSKSEELQVQQVFNDDFMGLKRIFAALAIIYLTDRPKRCAHDKAHKLRGPMKYNLRRLAMFDHARTTAQLRLILLLTHRLFCRPVAF